MLGWTSVWTKKLVSKIWKLKTVDAVLFLLFLAICVLGSNNFAYAQVTNGTFTGTAGTGWTSVISPNGTVVHTGTQVITTGDDDGVGGATFTATSQGISPTEAGVVDFTLISYSSTDSSNWDSPQVRFNGTFYSISTTGNLVTAGTGVQNSNQALGTNLTSRGFFPAGANTIQFGVYSRDSCCGAGIATWDNVQYQELTQSPGAQTTPQNTPLTIAASPQVATNMASTNTVVTLSVSNGILNLGTTAGVVITAGADGSGTVTFNGTPTAVNTALSGLIYTPNTGYSGSDTLAFTASVVGFNASINDTDNIPITVTAPLTYTYSLAKTRSPATVNAVGQTINYTITLTSTGTGAITGVNVTDSLAQVGGSTTALTLSGPTGNSAPTASLDFGEVWIYSASHTVTQAQIDNGGNLVNTATVSSTQGPTSSSSSPATTITQTPNMTLTKLAYEGGVPPSLGGTGTLAAANRPLNTVITYVYTVTNNGNITIDNIDVGDVHNGSGPVVSPTHLTLIDNGTAGDSPDGNASAAIWGTLAPLDVVIFTDTYTVTQSDINTL